MSRARPIRTRFPARPSAQAATPAALADADTGLGRAHGPDEDEAADPVGDGHSDADLAAGLPHQPGHPNPEPDAPADDAPVPADAADQPPGDSTRPHTPGRDPG